MLNAIIDSTLFEFLVGDIWIKVIDLLETGARYLPFRKCNEDHAHLITLHLLQLSFFFFARQTTFVDVEVTYAF